MRKPKSLGIKEATMMGLSRIIRDAEEEGLIVIQRNGVDVALVMPVTLRGLHNVQLMFAEVMADPSKLESNPDLRAFAVQLGKAFPMLEDVARKQVKKPRE